MSDASISRDPFAGCDSGIQPTCLAPSEPLLMTGTHRDLASAILAPIGPHRHQEQLDRRSRHGASIISLQRALCRTQPNGCSHPSGLGHNAQQITFAAAGA